MLREQRRERLVADRNVDVVARGVGERDEREALGDADGLDTSGAKIAAERGEVLLVLEPRGRILGHRLGERRAILLPGGERHRQHDDARDGDEEQDELLAQ